MTPIHPVSTPSVLRASQSIPFPNAMNYIRIENDLGFKRVCCTGWLCFCELLQQLFDRKSCLSNLEQNSENWNIQFTCSGITVTVIIAINADCQATSRSPSGNESCGIAFKVASSCKASCTTTLLQTACSPSNWTVGWKEWFNTSKPEKAQSKLIVEEFFSWRPTTVSLSLVSSWMTEAGHRAKVCSVTAPLRASEIMAAAPHRHRSGGFPSGKGCVSLGSGRNHAKNFSATLAVAMPTGTAQQAVEPKICSANQLPSKVENSSSCSSTLSHCSDKLLCEAIKNAHPPQLKSLP